MRRFILPVIALGIAAAPVAVEAQTPRGERGAFAGPFGARGMATANPAARVLQHREALGLSLDQVRQLQQIEARIEQRNQPLIDQLQALRPAAGGQLRQQMQERMRQHGAQVTPEQRAELQAHREAMRQATPEQRAELQQQMQERMRQHGAQITPDQRAELRQQMQERMRQHGAQITPEQRAELRQQMQERMQQQRAQITPEQRAELQAHREAMRQATPEQRVELQQQMQEQMRQRAQALTPEQRAQLGRRGGMGPAGVRPLNPEMRAQFEALRPVLEQLRESQQQARREVHEVLTAEQQAKLRALQGERAGEWRGQRGPGGDRPGPGARRGTTRR
jgi:Spy/CpxP family protein refolding chaperone